MNNLQVVLASIAGLDKYTQQAVVLSCGSESDYRNLPDDARGFGGILQQTGRWWFNNRHDVVQAVNAFVRDFTSRTGEHNGRLVEDCWKTQQWDAPDPRLDNNGFYASRETLNYVDHVQYVPGYLVGRLP